MALGLDVGAPAGKDVQVGEEWRHTRMVDRLRAQGRILSPEVERAFRAVPRHLFLPGEAPSDAYRDRAVVVKWNAGAPVSSASQPSMVAIMLEQLALRPGQRVLEIGTGTGYNAALMAYLVGPRGTVVSVDIDDDLVLSARQHLDAAGIPGVTLATRDGALGYRESAPYERIVLTVGSWDIQPAWWVQLAPGGRLLLPLSVRGSQLSVALDLIPGTPRLLRSKSVRSCAFVRLRGQGADPDGSHPLAVRGLAVHAVDERVLPGERVTELLAEPGAERLSPVQLAAVDLWDGFGLWLAVREPGMCRLLVSAEASGWWPSLLPRGVDGGTVALLGERGLAMIAPIGSTDVGMQELFGVAVRGYGPEGALLAGQLDRLLSSWAAAGRPTAAEMLLRAYPPGSDPPEGPGVAVSKQHSRLLLDWPGNPVPPGPILVG